jgi:chemotaxis protein CheZ
MSTQRKRFRVEVMANSLLPLPVVSETVPVETDIVAELRAIRDAMATPHVKGDAQRIVEAADSRELVESYRAQIAQCEKLKIEIDLIQDAIGRTKREIAVLHGKAFDSSDLFDVHGELGAIVGGTEQATQQILQAAEAIDHAASAMSSVPADQQKALCEDISDQVVSIFEACNFQDLTGQRIAKVMSTMSFIESQVKVMMDIWGGVDAIRVHAPEVVDEREGDAKLLNGPKGPDDHGHVSQDDIDALFD